MKNNNSIVDVVHIVREFMQNEAKTLEISKGKMLNDNITPTELERILRVS